MGQSVLLVLVLQDLDVAQKGKLKSEDLFLLKLLLLPQTWFDVRLWEHFISDFFMTAFTIVLLI